MPGWLATDTQVYQLIKNPERRALLRSCFPPIVEAGGGNVRMSEPLLDFCNVRLVLEGIGAGRGPQGMSAHAIKINATLLGVVNDDVRVNRSRCERLVQLAGGIVFNGLKKKMIGLVTMAEGIEVNLNAFD